MLKFFFSKVIGWDPKNLTYIYYSDYYTANSLTLSERLALGMHASLLVLVLATHLHGFLLSQLDSLSIICYFLS